MRARVATETRAAVQSAGAALAAYLSLPSFVNCTIGWGHPYVARVAWMLRYDAVGAALPTEALKSHCAEIGDKALSFVAVFLGFCCSGLLFGIHVAYVLTPPYLRRRTVCSSALRAIVWPQFG